MFLLFTSFSLCFAQKNYVDQPQLETSAVADSLVIPDRIYLSIQLNEADSKNKKSVEELERTLEATLKTLNLDTEKDLSLLDLTSNFKNYLLKGQNVLKSKVYTLLVRDAVSAGKVMAELENAGISNVGIERVEYSKAEELIASLKSKAVQKTRRNAEQLVRPLNQKLGKALYILDANSFSGALQGKASGIQLRGTNAYATKTIEPIFTEFQKIKFESHVKVIYALD